MLYKYFLSGISLLLALSLQSQPAPNFIVTDTKGVIHNLHEDHLDQGQTVVLKLFFVSCPPCNAFAPHFEPLYQKWGAGTEDVEFLSLTIRQSDDDEDVDGYKEEHDNTSPGVSAEGGANEAADLYTDGTYGPFLATPTFIVIGPDRTVYYDIRGNGIQGTIDAIDAQIAATGARRTIGLSGEVATSDDRPMPNIPIDLMDFDQSVDPTDNNGQFSTDVLIASDTTYFLTASKEDAHDNGVSILDMVKIRKHILGTEPFTTPYDLIAADVDKSGRISTGDLIDMQKLLLLNITAFEDQPAWHFINADYQFEFPAAPFEEVYDGRATQIPFSTDTENPVRIIGVKPGDVNGSADID